MIGKQPTLKDVELNLEELVLPVNLLSDEGVPSDDDVTEEEQRLYRVDTSCAHCEAGVRLVVYSSEPGIHRLYQLLLDDIGIVCPGCARNATQHGRRH